eukprot:1724673-Pleurochrysis_carterae.AAC.2
MPRTRARTVRTRCVRRRTRAAGRRVHIDGQTAAQNEGRRGRVAKQGGRQRRAPNANVERAPRRARGGEGEDASARQQVRCTRQRTHANDSTPRVVGRQARGRAE